MRSLLVFLVALGTTQAGRSPVNGFEGYQDYNYDSTDFGFAAPVNSGCPSAGGFSSPGYYIDRTYNSQCFPRKIYCTAAGTTNGSYVLCPPQMFFISDSDSSCYDGFDAAITCGVSVQCQDDDMYIVVSDAAVWQQTGSDLQVGFGPRPNACRFGGNVANLELGYDYDYSDYYTDFDISDGCGVKRTLINDGGDGIAIKYEAKIIRYWSRPSFQDSDYRVEEYHGALVTREKCFMADVACYYNADGTVTNSFQPASSNELDESDDSIIEFDMVPIDCTTRNEIGTQTVYVTDQVCYRVKLLNDWHAGFRVSTRKCWASDTGNPDYTDSRFEYYRLADKYNPNGDSQDSTFSWDCYSNSNTNLLEEDFSFSAFRFQEFNSDYSLNNPDYIQTINIHCEVNACNQEDTSSRDCTVPTACQNSNKRARRAASPALFTEGLSAVSSRKLTTQTIVMPRPQMNLIDPESYQQTKDSFTLGLMAVGGLLVVVVGALGVIHYQQKQVFKYHAQTNHA